MKKLFIVMLALVMAMSLVACASPSTTSLSDEQTVSSSEGADSSEGGDSNEPVTLVVWYWGEQEVPGYQNFMEAYADDFEANNPGVTVELTLQNDDTLISAFRTAEEAGQGPDVQYLWGGPPTVDEAVLGHLTPLDDYISKELYESLTKVGIGTGYCDLPDGKLWGLPAYEVAYSMGYNKEVCAKAGLDPEKPYTDWASFIDACEKIKAIGITPFGVGSNNGDAYNWWTFCVAAQDLDNMSEQTDAVTGETPYSGDKFTNYIAKFNELWQKGYINDDMVSKSLYQGQQMIEDGTAAFTMCVDARANALANQYGEDKIGFLPMPTFGTGDLANTFEVDAQSYVIPKHAKNKELAAKFITTMYEDEYLKMLYDYTGAKNSIKTFDWASIATSEISKNVSSWPSEGIGENSFFYRSPNIFDTDCLRPGFGKMIAGELTPEEVADYINNILAKWRSDYPEQVDVYGALNIPDDLVIGK